MDLTEHSQGRLTPRDARLMEEIVKPLAISRRAARAITGHATIRGVGHFFIVLDRRPLNNDLIEIAQNMTAKIMREVDS